MNRKIGLLHFFAPLRFGGGETFIINFLRASESVFENNLVLFSASSEFSKELAEIPRIAPDSFSDIDMGRGTKGAYIRLFLQILLHPFRLLKIINAHGESDIIIGHGFPFNFILPFLKKAGRLGEKRIIYFQHHRLMNSSGSTLQRIIYRRLFRNFDGIIANTPDVKNDIITIDKNLESKILIYSVGLDFAYIKEQEIKNEKKTFPEIPEDRLVAVYPARFMPHKNHRLFLKIFSELKKENLLERLFIVFSAGEGNTKEEFRNAVIREGFDKQCLFPEQLSHGDLLGLMARSDLCIFPSLEEGFGLAVLEALILEIPVISLTGAIPAELASFTIAAKDEDGFIADVLSLIRDDDFRKEEKRKIAENYKELREIADLSETSLKLRDSLINLTVNESRI